MNMTIELSLNTTIVLIVWAVAWVLRGMMQAAAKAKPENVYNTFNGALPANAPPAEEKPGIFTPSTTLKQ